MFSWSRCCRFRARLFSARGTFRRAFRRSPRLAGFATVVVDNREAFANRERFPEAAEVHAAEYEEIFPKLTVNENSYLIIVTRGHRDDMRVLKLALGTPARYIAMIGSKRKVINVIRELEKEGIAARGVRAHLRAHGPEYRRGFAGRDRHFGGRGNDRGAAQRGVQLALAFAFGLRGRNHSRRAVEVNCAGLILAAGESRRMGSPKALLPYRGRTFLDTLIGLFARAMRAGDCGAGRARSNARGVPAACAW